MAAEQRQRAFGIWRMLMVALLPLAALGLAKPAFAQLGSARYSSIVVSAAEGRVLEADHPDALRHPASLAKLMTLYLTFEALRDRRFTLDTLVPVSAHCSSMEPTKLGLLPGWKLTVQQAIDGIVTESANDAACALGELLGGSESRYAEMATLRARALGMSRTTFANASGLPDPNEWTTAHDMAVLARDLIIGFPQYYHYFSTPNFVYHGITFFNHDTMLKFYPGADGMKTGYTNASGHNLVTSAVRGGVRLIGVVLGAGSNGERDHDMTMALNGSFTEMDVPAGGRAARIAGNFSLMSSAHAATLEHPRMPAEHERPRVAERSLPVHRVMAREVVSPESAWTIQVGSFASEHTARIAADRARVQARRGDAHVERIRVRHRLWFRAQVTGFTEASAQEACSMIARHQRARCIILRPERAVVASR